MKNFTKILLLIFIFFIGMNILNAEEPVDNNTNLKVRAGTFIKVMNLNEISTLVSDIEDEVQFLNINDMYVYETNVIPKNTKIFGEVEDVLEPVQGRNGAIKILITKMITPDKKVYKVKGHLYSDNDNYFGGEETQPVYYRKVPHFQQRIRPILKAVPLNILEEGRHTVIKPGEELFVIIEEDIIAK